MNARRTLKTVPGTPIAALDGEEPLVEAVVADILRESIGARCQREAFAAPDHFSDVVVAALQATQHARQSF
ncbi:hypothetical protein MHPYR_840005 [uncultured Mycobacterium sp.]|uniref:Uncharacterized protein n=1 Tax=uncultured Mycobacterium sp. TaxID=171292 RepID=A0A1Y5PTT9_9MYCO|nr:hypothetical protein MHPYR_840005 [uncultured Mycobacterium sp.]